MLSMLCLGPLVEKQPVSPSWGGWGLILPSPQAAASCCYILWALAQSLGAKPYLVTGVLELRRGRSHVQGDITKL